MFRSRRRRFPFLIPALLVLAFLAATSGSGIAATGMLGLLLFVPLLMFKFFFMFLLFGAAMRFIGGGGPFRGGPPRRPDPPSREQQEWEEHLREARQEVDDLFPDP